MIHTVDKVRIDKWLWSVRLYKTRSQAADACNAGKVKIDGANCKAAREIKLGQVVHAKIGILLKEVVVIALIDKRVGAKLVPECYKDLTPQAEYEKIKALKMRFESRPSGIGRPTKKDYREIEKLKDYLKISDEEYQDYLESGVFGEVEEF